MYPGTSVLYIHTLPCQTRASSPKALGRPREWRRAAFWAIDIIEVALDPAKSRNRELGLGTPVAVAMEIAHSIEGASCIRKKMKFLPGWHRVAVKMQIMAFKEELWAGRAVTLAPNRAASAACQVGFSFPGDAGADGGCVAQNVW